MKTTARLWTGLFTTVFLSGVITTSALAPAAARSHRDKAGNDSRHARMDAQRAQQLMREGKYAKAEQKMRAAQKRQRMAQHERYLANH
jgi:hypothetical protein